MQRGEQMRANAVGTCTWRLKTHRRSSALGNAKKRKWIKKSRKQHPILVTDRGLAPGLLPLAGYGRLTISPAELFSALRHNSCDQKLAVSRKFREECALRLS